MIALDIETEPIAPGYQLPRPICLSVASADGATELVTGRDIPAVTRALLESGDDLIAHNASFDFGCLAIAYPELAPLIDKSYEGNRIKCSLLRDQLADFARGVNYKNYGLDAVCSRLDIPVPDKSNPWRTRFADLEHVPVSEWPESAIDYVNGDSLCALAISLAVPEPVDLGPQSRYDYWLTLSSAMGAVPDRAAVGKWANDLRLRESVARDKFIAAGFIRPDGSRNIKAIRERLAATGKARTTKKGAVKTDAISCKKSGDPLMIAYADYSALLSAINRELPIMQSPIVHTRYDMAETGRTISSKPNLQNMTNASGSRACFRPRDLGSVFLIADYGKLELCAVAQLCIALGTGDRLAKALRAGIDPHDMMVARLLALPLSDVRSHPNYKHTRRLAKEANFGFPGGMGITTFIETAEKRGIDLTRGQAEVLRKAWAHTWPEIPIYQERAAAYAERNDGALDHYRSGRLRGGLRYTQACNTLFQGLGADVTKAAGWALYRAGLLPTLFVHDEYVIEVPRDGFRDAAATVRRILRSVASEWLPDVGCDAEPCAADHWTKADPLYDEAGRLAVIEAEPLRFVSLSA